MKKIVLIKKKSMQKLPMNGEEKINQVRSIVLSLTRETHFFVDPT